MVLQKWELGGLCMNIYWLRSWLPGVCFTTSLTIQKWEWHQFYSGSGNRGTHRLLSDLPFGGNSQCFEACGVASEYLAQDFRGCSFITFHLTSLMTDDGYQHCISANGFGLFFSIHQPMPAQTWSIIATQTTNRTHFWQQNLVPCLQILHPSVYRDYITTGKKVHKHISLKCRPT